MYVLGKEESDFLLCHCNMDRTKRRRKKNINIREEAELKKKRKRIILKKSGGGGECERNRVPICERRNLRIYDVHIILLRQMASLFKARFLKGIH